MTKNDITYQDKLNELMLDISHPNNLGQVFVLVEGESDIRLFRKLFDLNNCKVECIPGGNPKLEECVGELINLYSLVIGIRDADFIRLGAVAYTKPNIFLTDNHDMEMSLISQDEVFSALIFEFTDIPKANHTSVRDSIIKAIEQISYLKYLNHLNSLELKFEAGFQDLISFANLEIDFTQYFARVLSKSPNAKVTDSTILLTQMNALKSANPNPFQLCNGHDFIKAFSHFVKEQGKFKSCNPDFVSSAFRMNFRNDLFKQSNLYFNTKLWADTNHCTIYA